MLALLIPAGIIDLAGIKAAGPRAAVATAAAYRFLCRPRNWGALVARSSVGAAAVCSARCWANSTVTSRRVCAVLPPLLLLLPGCACSCSGEQPA
jgi:hypothetical protein